MKAANLSRRVDWPSVAAVVAIIAMIGLMIAIIFRRQFRTYLYNRSPAEYYMSKHLPVAYLSDDGKAKDMWVTPSEFVAFGGLYNIAKGLKHGMCTDDAGWTQFCLFAAAKAYRTMRDDYGDNDRSVEEVVAVSAEETTMPYLRFLYGKIKDGGGGGGVSTRDMNRELDRVASETSNKDNFRGVDGRVIPGLTDTVFVVGV